MQRTSDKMLSGDAGLGKKTHRPLWCALIEVHVHTTVSYGQNYREAVAGVKFSCKLCLGGNSAL